MSKIQTNSNNVNQKSMLNHALDYHDAGITILPVNNKKIPTLKQWKTYQTEKPSKDQIEQWFNKKPYGMSIIPGSISDNIEIIDIDVKHDDPNNPVSHNVIQQIFEELPETFKKLYIENTPNKGFHIIYKHDDFIENDQSVQILAYNNKKQGLIELFTQNHLCTIHPTPNYEALKGDLRQLDRLTTEERLAIIDICREYDQYIIEDTPENTETKIPDNIKKFFTYTDNNGYSIYPENLAKAFLTLYPDTIYTNEDFFFQYDQINSVWLEVRSTEIKRQLKKIVSNIIHPKKITPTLFNSSFELLTINENIKIFDTANFNKQKHKIPLLNGIYNIAEKRFYSYTEYNSKEDYFTYQLPVKYQLDATCNLFNQCLFDWLVDTNVLPKDNEAIIDLMWEIIGYILLPDLPFHHFFIFEGAGQNGKGVLMKTISSLIGKDRVSNISIEGLDRENNRADIFGKLLNFTSELTTFKKLESGWIKAIASGDPIQARKLYAHSFTFQPFCKMIFTVNELPNFKDVSYGMQRRIKIIPFKKIIPENKRDVDLEKKLKNELSGILNFAIQGLHRLLDNKSFTDSEISTNATNEFIADSNSLTRFINDCCAIGEGKRIPKKLLYKFYVDYCKENDVKDDFIIGFEGRTSFTARLRSMGFLLQRNVLLSRDEISLFRQYIYDDNDSDLQDVFTSINYIFPE